MSNLKDLRTRIDSVKSTRKITSAMKMVAASKLRRAQISAESARPYAQRMDDMISRLVHSGSSTHPLLKGHGKDQRYLLVVFTANRGLCGGFNSNMIKMVRQHIAQLKEEGKKVSLLCVGRKGYEALRSQVGDDNIENYHHMISQKAPDFASILSLSNHIIDDFERDQFDVCCLYYNHFISAISQKPTKMNLIPFQQAQDNDESLSPSENQALYEYEPSEESVLSDLLPQNIAVQLFRALLESVASEQGARMSAMDNATRNAGDMIDRLTLIYNRTRQAQITKELIEIISGAEAL